MRDDGVTTSAGRSRASRIALVVAGHLRELCSTDANFDASTGARFTCLPPRWKVRPTARVAFFHHEAHEDTESLGPEDFGGISVDHSRPPVFFLRDSRLHSHSYFSCRPDPPP